MKGDLMRRRKGSIKMLRSVNLDIDVWEVIDEKALETHLSNSAYLNLILRKLFETDKKLIEVAI